MRTAFARESFLTKLLELFPFGSGNLEAGSAVRAAGAAGMNPSSRRQANRVGGSRDEDKI